MGRAWTSVAWRAAPSIVPPGPHVIGDLLDIDVERSRGGPQQIRVVGLIEFGVVLG
jgi:hypothetical protein